MAEGEGQAQEKTEAPTVKKREDSRKEGMVASSREVSSAALLGSFALYFLVAGKFNLDTMESVWRHAFSNLVAGDLDIEELGRVFRDVMMSLAPMMLGVFGLIFMFVHFWRVRKDGGISGPAPMVLESEMRPPRKGPRPVVMTPSGAPPKV